MMQNCKSTEKSTHNQKGEMLMKEAAAWTVADEL